MAVKVKLAPAEVVKAIKDGGGLIGVNASSKLLHVATPNFRRYRDRLTEVEVDGSASVFLKAEVEALAKEMAEQRRARD